LEGKLNGGRKMKKYTVVYEVEIKAKNIEKADLEETKNNARLKRIEDENESWERFYHTDD